MLALSASELASSARTSSMYVSAWSSKNCTRSMSSHMTTLYTLRRCTKWLLISSANVRQPSAALRSFASASSARPSASRTSPMRVRQSPRATSSPISSASSSARPYDSAAPSKAALTKNCMLPRSMHVRPSTNESLSSLARSMMCLNCTSTSAYSCVALYTSARYSWMEIRRGESLSLVASASDSWSNCSPCSRSPICTYEKPTSLCTRAKMGVSASMSASAASIRSMATFHSPVSA
mmetsp:Transcript_34192/g.94127  ORF Transcript_34192/g.94127 Transcript_34192/m.94127 type:complete len:237 (-) Transcript_34192:962-1672(-)